MQRVRRGRGGEAQTRDPVSTRRKAAPCIHLHEPTAHASDLAVGQVLLSLKMPTVIAAVEEHLADGKSVVLQLVTTAESILNRRLGELSPDERADLEIDLSPREYV